jgi:acetyl CoA:N6-hydroxylysine acetyl transferase
MNDDTVTAPPTLPPRRPRFGGAVGGGEAASPRANSEFEERDPRFDRVIWLRPVDVELDTPLVHHWMHKPHVDPWWEMAWSTDRIHDYLQGHHDDPTRSAYVGFVDDDPVGYLEVYDPAHDVLGAHYPVQPGDIGAHVLIGEESYLGRYSVALGFAVNRFLFQHPGVRRIVGEPDARHHKFLSLLAFLGFRKQAEIDLPDKRAALMVCDHAAFDRLRTRRKARSDRARPARPV